MSKLWNAKQKKAIELLANGDMLLQDIASELNINITTLHNWRNKTPGFNEAVLERARNKLKAHIPEVYKAMRKFSATNNPTMIKTLLEHIDKLEEKANQSQNASITFTWQAITPTNTTGEDKE